MHGAPLAVNLAQTHGQSKFKRFPLTARIDVDALSYSRRESNILPAGDLHIVKVKGDRLLVRGKEHLPSRHISIKPRDKKGGGTSNIKISGS
jgi:hypothetical protein